MENYKKMMEKMTVSEQKSAAIKKMIQQNSFQKKQHSWVKLIVPLTALAGCFALYFVWTSNSPANDPTVMSGNPIQTYPSLAKLETAFKASIPQPAKLADFQRKDFMLTDKTIAEWTYSKAKTSYHYRVGPQNKTTLGGLEAYPEKVVKDGAQSIHLINDSQHDLQTIGAWVDQGNYRFVIKGAAQKDSTHYLEIIKSIN